MRVLHVINRFSQAGAETSLREFISETSGQLDHGICVLYPDRNDFLGDSQDAVERFVPTSSLGRLPAVQHVSQAIRQYRPQLVHTTLFDANTAGRLAARRSRVPVLTSLVNTPYVSAATTDRQLSRTKRMVVRQADRMLSRHATDHFHAITEAVAEEYARDFGLSRDKITVVPRGRSRARLGLPSSERRETARTQLGIAPSTRLLLTLGRQEAQKGHRYLLSAVPELLCDWPDLVLLIAGREGAMSSSLRQLQQHLGLHDHVRFLGRRGDVGDLLAAADAFVFPSLYEGLGGAVLEAMAMGTPIVASDVPALREVLENGRAGLLVQPAEPGALSRGIRTAFENPINTSDRTEAAKERFERHYSSRAAVAGMLELYRRMLTT